MAVSLTALQSVYADTTDPWNFRTSGYEHAKFAATLAALSHAHYRQVLEIGCGNGELAKRLCLRCASYVGLDAVDVAIAEAEKSVPSGEFHQCFLPCRLPDGAFDLIVASEILYFLDQPGIFDLAGQIIARWPGSEIVAVNYLESTGNGLGGDEAADLFGAALAGHFQGQLAERTDKYRIDRYQPIGRGAR